MYTLTNDQLSVLILDPAADVNREGSRYCTGGYIWQVMDTKLGELLSGPEYPKEPNTFDGQGMPDMFLQALGADIAPMGGDVGCIGVGRVRRTTPGEPFDVRLNREVISFVPWEVHVTQDTIQMDTNAEFHDWGYHLERTVTLNHRTVHSRTAIRSTGAAVLPVRWFAHPFFPIPLDGKLCAFSVPAQVSENPGFVFGADDYLMRKPDHHWPRGWFQPVEYAKNGISLTATQKHPKVGEVIVRTDFMPTYLPVWGNDRTFSFEPYFERSLSLEESAAWAIDYQF